MLAGFLVCLFVGLLIIFLGYQIHVKKRLFLLAGYQEETFVGDKNKLAKLSGAFSYSWSYYNITAWLRKNR